MGELLHKNSLLGRRHVFFEFVEIQASLAWESVFEGHFTVL